MEIIGFEPQDRPRWTELWRAYLSFYETSLPDDVFEHTWRRLLDGTALHGLAARVDGRMVGITHFLFHGSAWTAAPICYLQDLYVDDAARGQGAGRGLAQVWSRCLVGAPAYPTLRLGQGPDYPSGIKRAELSR